MLRFYILGDVSGLNGVFMTMGIWRCVKCGWTEFMVPIYSPPLVCPRCKAEYEIVKVLEGAHISHSIPVTRLKGTDKLNVVAAIAFTFGENKEAVLEYLKIIVEVFGEDFLSEDAKKWLKILKEEE
ncbi:hypothetical protein DRO47_06100 [Candidatus Bathyarchaeota archaeon]|nr:MAG: hypothetical protein DRO47_06100 [Candidatus Bathyarchaeota archaeon]